MISEALSSESPDGTEKSLGTSRSGTGGSNAEQGSGQGRSTNEGLSNLRDDDSATGSTNLLQGGVKMDPPAESSLGGMGGSSQGTGSGSGGGSSSGGDR
ncbi:MAG: hypothetical protein H0X43_02985 [Nitrosospira sp.]|nr:hypothetical protein [Nitrosospira sp.]